MNGGRDRETRSEQRRLAPAGPRSWTSAWSRRGLRPGWRFGSGRAGGVRREAGPERPPRHDRHAPGRRPRGLREPGRADPVDGPTRRRAACASTHAHAHNVDHAPLARQHPLGPLPSRPRRAGQLRLPLSAGRGRRSRRFWPPAGTARGPSSAPSPSRRGSGSRRGFEVYDDRFVGARPRPAFRRAGAAGRRDGGPRPPVARGAARDGRSSAGCTSTSRTIPTSPPSRFASRFRRRPVPRRGGRGRRRARPAPRADPGGRRKPGARSWCSRRTTASRSGSTARRPTGSSPTRRRCGSPSSSISRALLAPARRDRRRCATWTCCRRSSTRSRCRCPRACPAAACCPLAAGEPAPRGDELLRGALGPAQSRLGPPPRA